MSPGSGSGGLSSGGTTSSFQISFISLNSTLSRKAFAFISPVLFRSLSFNAAVLVATLRAKVYMPVFTSIHVVAILIGKVSAAQIKEQRADTKELELKAITNDIEMMPSEIGTEQSN